MGPPNVDKPTRRRPVTDDRNRVLAQGDCTSWSLWDHLRPAFRFDTEFDEFIALLAYTDALDPVMTIYFANQVPKIDRRSQSLIRSTIVTGSSLIASDDELDGCARGPVRSVVNNDRAVPPGWGLLRIANRSGSAHG